MKTGRIPVITKWALALVLVLALLPALGAAKDTATLDKQLFQAAWRGDLALVRTLLAKGANVNARGDNGWTPLIHAAYAGRTKVVDLLLSKGADIEAKTDWRETALMYAVKDMQDDVVKLLLDKGADINARDEWGRTALMTAALMRTAPAVKLLLDRGADINAKDKSGRTALMNAAQTGCMGHPNVVKLLLARGADINAKNSRGISALRLAEMAWHKEVAEILRAAGAYDDEAERGRTVPRLSHAGRPADQDPRPYPDTPAGVVAAFLEASLADSPITVAEMRACVEVTRAGCQYLPNTEDIGCRDFWSEMDQVKSGR